MSCAAQYNRTSETMAAFGCAADSVAATWPKLTHDQTGRAMLTYADGKQFITRNASGPQPQRVGDMLDHQWLEKDSGAPAPVRVRAVTWFKMGAGADMRGIEISHDVDS